ncbi:MAG: sulfotransferase [Peptococcaceae bacterium]|nr:sulfotransferase [Peptococcaceae bacterium]
MLKKIAIFGVARSGTSWLAQIFNSHPDVVMRFQPLFSYSHKGKLTEISNCEDINSFFNEILHSDDPFVLMKAEMHRNYPRFNKSAVPTHIAFKETRYINVIENMLWRSEDIRVIGIVRNPLANIASWIRAPKEFDPAWDILKEWRYAPLKNKGKSENFYGFEKWKQVASNFLRYKQEYPERFFLVTYSDLNQNTLRTVEKLFAFCNLKQDKQVEQFIAQSKSRHDSDPYSVFRANASDQEWRNILPREISDSIIAELTGTGLEQFLNGGQNA